MDFVADAKEVAQAADYAAKAIGKPTHPIHTAARVKAADGQVTITGFDPAAAASATAIVQADVQAAGEVLIPAQLLAAVTAKLGGEVRFAVEGSAVIVTAGRSRMTLPQMPLEDAPVGLPDADRQVAQLPLEVVKELVAQVAFAAASDAGAPPQLSSVSVELRPDGVTMTATDRYRLATRSVEWDGQLSDGVEVLIPAKYLNDTVRAMRASDGVVHVGLVGTQLVLATDQRVAKLGSLGQDFVPWRRLIPEDEALESHITFSAAEAKDVLDRLSTVLMPKAAIEVKATKGILSFSTSDSESTQAGADQIESALDGSSVTLRVNPQYLRAGLDVVGDVDVKVSVQNAKKPFLVTSDDVPGFTFLVMPIVN